LTGLLVGAKRIVVREVLVKKAYFSFLMFSMITAMYVGPVALADNFCRFNRELAVSRIYQEMNSDKIWVELVNHKGQSVIGVDLNASKTKDIALLDMFRAAYFHHSTLIAQLEVTTDMSCSAAAQVAGFYLANQTIKSIAIGK